MTKYKKVRIQNPVLQAWYDLKSQVNVHPSFYNKERLLFYIDEVLTSKPYRREEVMVVALLGITQLVHPTAGELDESLVQAIKALKEFLQKSVKRGKESH